MATTRITLTPATSIPFDKLVLSQANVRRVKAGISIEDLADDIARRGLLATLSVRVLVDADGTPTDRYEVPVGGRRYRALQHLVRTRRLARTASPCTRWTSSAPSRPWCRPASPRRISPHGSS
ncbi:MAG: hypothetical protein RLY86_4254 [Pseudomonadota bacterium]|jgi:ParB family chromosome partitioning protein